MIKKKITFISVARSDFGRLYPTLKQIDLCDELDLQLIVTGNHTSEKYGNSLDEITSSGLRVDHSIELISKDMAGISAEIHSGLNEWCKESHSDYFVILGDRYEMLAAAETVFLNNIPIIHIGGGYTTLGAIDDRIRHAITQLSTYHFTATEKCKARVVELTGKEENIFIYGAPDIEILKNVDLLEQEEFYKSCHLDLSRPFALVTVHPETLASAEENKLYLLEFEKFLCEINEQILITAPCADPGSDLVFTMIDRLKAKIHDLVYIESLGMKKYASAMKYTDMMLGNSSSGIIESATMGTPVLNVGQRQGGREVNSNVLTASFNYASLLSSYKQLKSLEFKKTLSQTTNIYGDGQFSDKFLKFLSILK